MFCSGHSDESNEEEPNLKSIWTTLASGSARSRRARPCALDPQGQIAKENGLKYATSHTIDIPNTNNFLMVISHFPDFVMCVGFGAAMQFKTY